ncbi:MAG: TetR/AcrR family transcriptional regulator [Paludibacter sp.]|jgi:AcrR family transcriptional regulator|nr:TetR/AcrR family transcriptional regulator [Paludibacter sp.]
MDIKTEQSTEKIILEVAERLFLEKGFAMTSTTEIAKEVGCNQALVHYYFRTKDNLFNTIFEQKFKDFFQWIFEIKSTGELEFLDKLKLIIESHFDLLMNNPKMPALILNELSRKPEQISMLKDKLEAIPVKLFSELNAELQTAIAQGKVRKIDLIDLIVSMITMNVAIFVMMPVVENILSLDESKKKFMIQHRRAENVDFILKSLRP